MSVILHINITTHLLISDLISAIGFPPSTFFFMHCAFFFFIKTAVTSLDTVIAEALAYILYSRLPEISYRR